MFNPDSAPFARMFLPAMEAVRSSSAFELIISPVRNEAELDRAIAVAGRPQSGGLIALPDSFLNSRHEMIVALTAKHHLPAIYAVSEFTRSGGLIAYGIERADLFRCSVRRSHPKGRETRRPRDLATDQVRACHQPQDC